ncbi:SlyX family protein [Halovivax gelatinilyticus]|uniref:SlyX family protein n=1 Tax=Halovivax gelatinilyticus TaxID=2961597 RepID=UPI0020CA84BC|nr:SlyX family protein [Halovivax gelatinilyticus]
MDSTTRNPDEIDDRLDRLESLIETQQETIEELTTRNEAQQETIEQLEAITDERPTGGKLSELPAVSRRSALAGLAGLAGLGAMSSSTSATTPQGQVGTEDHPLNALHTVDLEATEIAAENDGDDDETTAIQGHASALDVEAATKGVAGIADADADNAPVEEIVPAGVEGTATGDGATHGVRGVSESINGRGIAGFATSDDYDHSTFTGSGIGVVGVTDRSGDDDGISDSGGVFGMATAESGTAYGVIGRTESPDGWGVRGMDMSGDGHGVYSYGDSKTDGDHETTGDTVLGGELSFSDDTPQRTAGPIAKGSINSDGSIENAVNVSDAEWNEGEERYRITLTDENYFYDDYVTTITPTTSALWRVTSNSNQIIVEFEDTDGDPLQRDFQFVTFDLPSGTETTAADARTGESTDDTEADDERASSSAGSTPDSHE